MEQPDLFGGSARPQRVPRKAPKPAQTSAQARDEAIERVSINNQEWLFIAVLTLPAMRADHPGEFTGEDVRLWLRGRGVPEPAHHNAYGAMIMSAVRAGVIERTGAIRKAQIRTSHARNLLVYRWVSKDPGGG
jgi:hypothetical protein